MTIHVDPFDRSSITSAIRQLRKCSGDLDKKANELCERLALMGALYAAWNFSGVLYAGDVDCNVSVERKGQNAYAIKASGQTVLFMEFGAGVNGYGHPMAPAFGMGPGTYPGQTHAFDPNGWWFRQDGQAIHTYGNVPGMPMYNAEKDLTNDIEQVAREVLQL